MWVIWRVWVTWCDVSYMTCCVLSDMMWRTLKKTHAVSFALLIVFLHTPWGSEESPPRTKNCNSVSPVQESNFGPPELEAGLLVAKYFIDGGYLGWRGDSMWWLLLSGSWTQLIKATVNPTHCFSYRIHSALFRLRDLHQDGVIIDAFTDTPSRDTEPENRWYLFSTG